MANEPSAASSSGMAVGNNREQPPPNLVRDPAVGNYSNTHHRAASQYVMSDGGSDVVFYGRRGSACSPGSKRHKSLIVLPPGHLQRLPPVLGTPETRIDIAAV